MTKFQSTLPVWGATRARRIMTDMKKFQSTLPVWGATHRRDEEPPGGEVISIHAPRVGSDPVRPGVDVPDVISIHAPRVGSDSSPSPVSPRRCDFNPRSPCGERRGERPPPLCQQLRFQSTLPVWGATSPKISSQHGFPNFNPRSPCGERLAACQSARVRSVFQSTLPVWGATCGGMLETYYCEISIHAPRVGSDLHLGAAGQQNLISIHAPRVGSDPVKG